MKATFKTADNFGNLNGKPLDVVEIRGRRVSVKIWSEEFQKDVITDFALSEVVEFTNGAQFPIVMGWPGAMTTPTERTEPRQTMNSRYEAGTGDYFLVFYNKDQEIARVSCTDRDIHTLRNSGFLQ